MKNYILFLFTFYLFMSTVFAQPVNNLGFTSSIGSSSFLNLAGVRLSNSYGIGIYNEVNSSLYYNIGIGVLNGGYKTEVDTYGDNLNPYSTEVYAFHLLKLLVIPTTIGIYLNEHKSTGFNIGLVHQYVLSEDIDMKTWGVDNLDYSLKENNPYRLSAQFKLDFIKSINENLFMLISPFYLRELNIHNFFLQHQNIGLELSIYKKF